MKISDLLISVPFRNELQKLAPISPYTNQPLSLVTYGDDFPRWENSTDPEWWEGAADCSYPKQIKIPVTPDLIEEAAIAAGFDADTVKLQCATWIAEIQANAKDHEQQSAARQQRILDNQAEAIRLIIKRIEEKRAHDHNPQFGVKKQLRLEAALEGKPDALKLSDKFEIDTIAGSL